ncbi:MAG: malonyl-ACP O-methyltransferase BioC [Pseudomonadota bacterium]
MEYKSDSFREQSIKRTFDIAANTYDKFAVLQREINDRLLECFDLFSIQCDRCLDLGSGTGYASGKLKKIFKRSRIIQTDLSFSMLSLAKDKQPLFFSGQHQTCATAKQLPFSDNSFDVVYSNLMLQWCPYLDDVFAEIHRVLRQGGVFVFSSFGPDTLQELRQSWQSVDSEIHVNTFIDMHDVGDALVRHSLTEPVLSAEHIQIRYETSKQLMRELKQIGAQNNNLGRRKSLTGKQRMQRVINEYENYRSDGTLPATYEIIIGHAWKTGAGSDVDALHSVSLHEMKQKLKKHKRGQV